MLTEMTGEDWAIMLEVFDPAQSRAGRPCTMTVRCWKRCTPSPSQHQLAAASGEVRQLEQYLVSVMAAEPCSAQKR